MSGAKFVKIYSILYVYLVIYCIQVFTESFQTLLFFNFQLNVNC